MTGPTPEEQLKALGWELRGDFEREPVEDGMEHEAEHTLERAFRDIPQKPLLQWLEDACTNADRPAFASSALHCLAVIKKPGTPEWRAGLVARTLASDDIEIRDQAIQAAEQWEEPGATEALAAHDEPLGWLRQYAQAVLENMRKPAGSNTGRRVDSIFTDKHGRRLRELQNSSQNRELTNPERGEMETLVSRWQQAYNDHQSKALEQERQADEARNSQAGDGDAG